MDYVACLQRATPRRDPVTQRARWVVTLTFATVPEHAAATRRYRPGSCRLHMFRPARGRNRAAVRGRVTAVLRSHVRGARAPPPRRAHHRTSVGRLVLLIEAV